MQGILNAYFIFLIYLIIERARKQGPVAKESLSSIASRSTADAIKPHTSSIRDHHYFYSIGCAAGSSSCWPIDSFLRKQIPNRNRGALAADAS